MLGAPHTPGVGGMGIGVVNEILVRAGHKQGYHVLFQDKKGLAIRNGGVYSQISFIRDDGEAARQQGTQARRRNPIADGCDLKHPEWPGRTHCEECAAGRVLWWGTGAGEQSGETAGWA